MARIIRKLYNEAQKQKNDLSKKSLTKQKKNKRNFNTELIQNTFSDDNWAEAHTVEEINGSYSDNTVYG